MSHTSEEIIKMQKDALMASLNAIDEKIEDESDNDAVTYLKKLKKEAKQKEEELEIASLEAQEEQENQPKKEEVERELSKAMLREDEVKKSRQNSVKVEVSEPEIDSQTQALLELQEELTKRNIPSRIVGNFLETDMEGDLKTIDPAKMDTIVLRKTIDEVQRNDEVSKKELVDKYTKKDQEHNKEIEEKYINPDVGSYIAKGIPGPSDSGSAAAA